MDNLEQVYEAAEILKELKLPISIELLEKIERLEDEKGIEHREDFRNYFLQQHFVFFTKRILNIRQAKVHGETIVAKPVLMVAIIDGIEANVFANNQFVINDWLEKHYNTLMSQFVKGSQFDATTGIEKPFWHLESDGFWHLNYQGERLSKGRTPSKAWLKESVDYAYFDEALWILLQNKEWRLKLRDYIIEHKLSDDFWSGKMVAEGLGILAAVILAA